MIENDNNERVDLKWWRSKHVNFRDDGYLRVGGSTRKYSVFSRKSGSLLGTVQWFVQAGGYVFLPLNSIFDKHQMRQIATFCEEATSNHKLRYPPKPKQFLKRKIAKEKYY